ncbi:putative receptor-type adenylate cyclase [Trypanosoma grayi]|uniref:putative receptor-type adenylate cyclase n=1 Tax=Trypanosoma grayi TaxID=71804 RepID=UPI0004F4871C|nr:putative receptor-type adenylate cyclase [Trypanosoma grayi]KEG11168.1 putative receptor-type adenylate cyclase [Trypanosoma grayi]
MAARTESVANGGQVLLTGAAYLALSTAEREQLDVTALGGVALRGVPVPVAMYQLNAVPGRTFAALRLDRQDAADLCEESTSSGSLSSQSKNVQLSGTASAVAHLLSDFYTPVAVPQRMKMLTVMCERWNVRVLHKSWSASPIDHCNEMIERLAVKMGHVLDQKVRGKRDSRGAPFDNYWNVFKGSMTQCSSVHSYSAVSSLRMHSSTRFGDSISGAVCSTVTIMAHTPAMM